MKEKLPKPHPHFPAEYELADVMAIKALAVGDADKDQQLRALKWIIETLCETHGLSFRPESDRETVFAEGKRHVGLQIIKLIRINSEVARRGIES